jgi:hypothetical protein
MWHAWERREKCRRFWWGSLKARDHSKDRGVGGRMGSQLILGRLAGGWSGFSWLRIGPVAGSCEYGDEPSGSSSIERSLLVLETLVCPPRPLYAVIGNVKR